MMTHIGVNISSLFTPGKCDKCGGDLFTRDAKGTPNAVHIGNKGRYCSEKCLKEKEG